MRLHLRRLNANEARVDFVVEGRGVIWTPKNVNYSKRINRRKESVQRLTREREGYFRVTSIVRKNYIVWKRSYLS